MPQCLLNSLKRCMLNIQLAMLILLYELSIDQRHVQVKISESEHMLLTVVMMALQIKGQHRKLKSPNKSLKQSQHQVTTETCVGVINIQKKVNKEILVKMRHLWRKKEEDKPETISSLAFLTHVGWRCSSLTGLRNWIWTMCWWRTHFLSLRVKCFYSRLAPKSKKIKSASFTKTFHCADDQ